MEMWYTEKHSENVGITMKVTETLFSGKSEFQQLDIVQTLEYGKMMLLDGLVMVTERDEFVYHDMIAHPALFTHPAPKNVLVIGGGDGGSIREIMKHPGVEQATLCEIDGLVIEKSIELLPSMACEIDGSNSRVKLHVDDGLAYIRDHQNEFDVILVDSTDPIGPAVGLFEEDFYRLVHGALKEDGIMVAQSESPFYHADIQKAMYGNLRNVFPIVEMYQAFIPTYPSGLWSFAFASKKYHPVNDFDQQRAANRGFHTRYYNEQLHLGAFMLPTFARENIA
ncbi:polyamine aminopropyltransferase [Desulfuromonas acetoxidans]|uniref:Polyamine aminopropyltransferase n=1 Tax=Desulfuromonas acetoxidans (strain DSM 684 / 11070) TaxID=281689 RepID=Q1K205_DESA6|nr:polyamine aminopropyltransferase [Desulfuromonas acetoxidans]EAT16634.1 spermidine synthase [Desulfuromonas acetoxidans DSM 684]MBF0646491.1 polyamine aminopropyltransferase [Desulfuromonas acetoxidans]NVD24745.1 polyamine aminopropyltransferase [Desulfuromonas acetoxidans]NVE16790.1 polyamine aminopropyltransferase [Desulfuromonas acetoxidans]